jgi:hypothetical protein
VQASSYLDWLANPKQIILIILLCLREYGSAYL